MLFRACFVKQKVLYVLEYKFLCRILNWCDFDCEQLFFWYVFLAIVMSLFKFSDSKSRWKQIKMIWKREKTYVSFKYYINFMKILKKKHRRKPLTGNFSLHFREFFSGSILLLNFFYWYSYFIFQFQSIWAFNPLPIWVVTKHVFHLI